MKLTIRITKEVLRESMFCGIKPGAIWDNCAITKACRVIFTSCWTTLDHLWLSDQIIIDLPEEAKEFILKFDGTTPYCRVLLPEFSFTIDVPDSVIESIGIEEAKAIIEKSSTLELA